MVGQGADFMATLLSPEQAQRNGHTVIDVREFPEHAAGAIIGSRLVPLSTVEKEAAAWKREEPVLLVCRSGKRATQAADTLERLGFQNVNILQGGMDAWKNASLPINVEDKRPWSIERQVRAIAGGLVLLFTLLGLTASSWFFAGTLFAGAGLLFAGVTDVCFMATALGQLPWNKASVAQCEIKP